jgi:hypothetical protein
MIKRSIIAAFGFLALNGCSHPVDTTTIQGLTIDPGIKKKAEKQIERSKDLDIFSESMQVYVNTGEIQSYENDQLTLNTSFGEYKSPFKSFYFWRGDSLTIDGAFGIWGGIGFDITIHDKKATIHHMLSSDDYPSYAYQEKDSLIFRLEVPCTDTKIILSEIPDSSKKQIIYGYVEFKSGSYYASQGSINEVELPRKKMRQHMKLYFKSGFLEMPQ